TQTARRSSFSSGFPEFGAELHFITSIRGLSLEMIGPSGAGLKLTRDERILMSISLTSHLLCDRLDGFPLVQRTMLPLLVTHNCRASWLSLSLFQSHGLSGGLT